jgi:hypothetical protein
MGPWAPISDPGQPAAILHRVGGLTLASFIPLQELPPGDGDAAAWIRRRALPEGPGLPLIPGGARFRAAPGEVVFHRPEVGTFRIAGGSLIEIDPAPGADDDLLRLHILGPALAHLLQERGLAVLHGSAVRIAGKAALFLGPSGAGKSTLACALEARGHELLADDLAPLGEGPSGPVLVPAVRRLKLRSDSLRWFGLEGASVPLHGRIDKRAPIRELPTVAAPLPLGTAFVIDRGERPSIRPLPPQEAFLALLRMSFCARFLERVVLPSHLRILGSAVRAARVSVLDVPADFAALDDVVRLIEEDLGA